LDAGFANISHDKKALFGKTHYSLYTTVLVAVLTFKVIQGG